MSDPYARPTDPAKRHSAALTNGVDRAPSINQSTTAFVPEGSIALSRHRFGRPYFFAIAAKKPSFFKPSSRLPSI